MASWKSNKIIESLKPKPTQESEQEPAIEGLVDYTYDATNSKDFDFYDGKDFNHQLLGITASARELGLDKITDTVQEETVGQVAIPSFTQQIEEIKKQGDIRKVRKLVSDLIKALPQGIEKSIHRLADLIVAFYYENTEKTEAKTSHQVIVQQMQLYLIIPLTFWVALNWWYVWNYTNFSFNFMDALKYFPFNILHYVVEPGFYVLEMMNYYVLTIRMDKDLSCSARAFIETLWDWRPITFTLFAFGMAGILKAMPVSDTAGGMISGETTAISGLIFIGTICAFFYLTATCMKRMMYFNNLLQNAFLLMFMLLLFFLFVLIVAGFASSIALLYFLFFSYFVLIVFERFHFVSKILEIFNDLTTAPVKDPDAKFEEKPFTFVKQFIFRNFFGLCWVFCGVLPIFIYSMIKISTIRNLAMMITLILFVILLDAILLFPVSNIINEVIEIAKKMMLDKGVDIQETVVTDELPPPLKKLATRSDESRSLLNDIILFLMNPI